MDLFAYETAFGYIANELNNMPICLGTNYQNLEKADVLTPARLLLGRNNQRTLLGFPRISDGSRWAKELEEVNRKWWTTWSEERLGDFISHPRKWHASSKPYSVGDVVLFVTQEAQMGDSVWKMGRVVELKTSRDGVVRRIRLEYRNPGEAVFRQTDRPARNVALLHREGDLELKPGLALAQSLQETK